MCTVTVVPLDDGGVRLACNRDELRTRGPADPPCVVSQQDTTMLMPIDPQSGGTWIGANDHGLIATLLNVNPRTPPHWNPTVSRGDIVPRVLRHRTMEPAIDEMLGIDRTSHRPFRVVITDGAMIVEIRSDSDGLREVNRRPASGAVFFTSSGIGDHLVETPRRELFESMFAGVDGEAEACTTQDALHRHSWPDRGALSVNMAREDAQTVSLTVVEMTHDIITMRYIPGRPTDVSNEAVRSLPRRAVVGR